jgi:hypothetical protein
VFLIAGYAQLGPVGSLALHNALRKAFRLTVAMTVAFSIRIMAAIFVSIIGIYATLSEQFGDHKLITYM